jgi:hypothetical protein
MASRSLYLHVIDLTSGRKVGRPADGVPVLKSANCWGGRKRDRHAPQTGERNRPTLMATGRGTGSKTQQTNRRGGQHASAGTAPICHRSYILPLWTTKHDVAGIVRTQLMSTWGGTSSRGRTTSALNR